MPIRNESNVFVTGAGGFIGANIVRLLLKKNYTVHVLQKDQKLSWRLSNIARQLIVHKGDLTNFNSINRIVSKIQPNYIIHLAAYGAYHYQNEFEKIMKVNIEGTKNLLEASKNISYSAFINTGSSSEYGYKNHPMKEDEFCDPVSYYAAAKLAQTQMCKVFAKNNNKPIVTLRLFSVYGPFEEQTRFVPTILRAIIKNEAINLTPGKQRRDFIYIDDVSKVYLKAFRISKKHYGEIYNVGTGVEFSNDEVVKTLFSFLNKKTVIKKGAYPKRSWDTNHWLADISKIQKDFNWKPEYNMEKGLAASFYWYKKYLTSYN
jgi:nucleoside-diphosphate-sugar epimerase